MGRRVYPLMRRLALSLEPECRVLTGLPDAGKDKKKKESSVLAESEEGEGSMWGISKSVSEVEEEQPWSTGLGGGFSSCVNTVLQDIPQQAEPRAVGLQGLPSKCVEQGENQLKVLK